MSAPKTSSRDLALVRIKNSEECLNDAKRALSEEAFKTANNRAYYSIEKSIKALLALNEIDAKTHSGIRHLFHEKYIKEQIGGFSHDDWKRLGKAEVIRSNSDYDDFYIVSKEDTVELVDFANSFYKKVCMYLKDLGII